MLDYLEQLRDCSLLTVEENGRYRMLETLREYAWEQLGVLGERDAIRRRHWEWYLHVAERGWEEAELPEEREIDNFRAALRAAREVAERDGDRTAAEARLRLASALDWFWNARGRSAEGLEALEAALVESADLPAAVRARALDAAALMAAIAGQGERSAAFRRESRPAYEALLPAARQRGREPELAATLLNLLQICYWTGDLDAAWSYGSEARRLMEEQRDAVGLLRVLEFLPGIRMQRGDLATARTLMEERLALCRKLEKPDLLVHTLGGMGHLERDEGHFAQARAYYQESLVLRHALGHWAALAQSFEDLALLAGRAGQMKRAIRLLGAQEAFCETLGTAPPLADAVGYPATVAAGRAALGEAPFAALWAEGRALALDQAIAYAMEAGEGD